MSEIANILSKFISLNLKPDKTCKNTIATTTDDLKKSKSRLGYFKDEDKVSLSSDAIYSLNDKSNNNLPNEAVPIALAEAAGVEKKEKSKNLLPDELKGAYSYFKKYYPQEAEEMMDMCKKGKLKILGLKEFRAKTGFLYPLPFVETKEKYDPKTGKTTIEIEEGYPDGYTKLLNDNTIEMVVGQINPTEKFSENEIAAHMRHEFWHVKFYNECKIKYPNRDVAELSNCIQEPLCYQKQLEFANKMLLDIQKEIKKIIPNEDLQEKLKKLIELKIRCILELEIEKAKEKLEGFDIYNRKQQQLEFANKMLLDIQKEI